MNKHLITYKSDFGVQTNPATSYINYLQISQDNRYKGNIVSR